MSHSSIVLKWLGGRNLFSAERIPLVNPTSYYKAIWASPKLRALPFPSQPCPKLWTLPILGLFWSHHTVLST